MLVAGGVPEHFNLPWRAAAGTGFWKAQGLDVEWREQKGGTGQMLNALADGTLDVAVLLTEGIVRRVAAGLQARIVAQYISSPLLWGIHVAAAGTFRSERSVAKGARFAITRFGSGSHLMAYVLAERLGIVLEENQLVVVGTLEGARHALANNEADVLLWDRFMLSPLVRDGELRRVGVQPTPWPSFVIAASRLALEHRRDEVDATCLAISELAQTLRHDPRSAALAVDLYGLLPEETDAWLKTTQWDSSPISEAELDAVQQQLLRVGILDAVTPAARFLAPRGMATNW